MIKDFAVNIIAKVSALLDNLTPPSPFAPTSLSRTNSPLYCVSAEEACRDGD